MKIVTMTCKDKTCIVSVMDDNDPVAIEAFSNELNAKHAIRLLVETLRDAGIKVEVADDGNRAKK